MLGKHPFFFIFDEGRIFALVVRRVKMKVLHNDSQNDYKPAMEDPFALCKVTL
jgi:hypothetical protein